MQSIFNKGLISLKVKRGMEGLMHDERGTEVFVQDFVEGLD